MTARLGALLIFVAVVIACVYAALAPLGTLAGAIS